MIHTVVALCGAALECGQRLEKISFDVCSRRSTVAAEAQFLQIQNAGIIETPLDGIDRLEHRGLSRVAADIHLGLFAATDQDRPLCIGQF